MKRWVSCESSLGMTRRENKIINLSTKVKMAIYQNARVRTEMPSECHKQNVLWVRTESSFLNC